MGSQVHAVKALMIRTSYKAYGATLVNRNLLSPAKLLIRKTALLTEL
jgi:hypothetical protein